MNFFTNRQELVWIPIHHVLFQWSLVCGNGWYVSLTSIVFLVGFIIGAAMVGPTVDTYAILYPQRFQRLFQGHPCNPSLGSKSKFWKNVPLMETRNYSFENKNKPIEMISVFLAMVERRVYLS